MASFNKVILMGRLTATPELKQTQGGTAVTSFTIAIDRRFSKEGQEKQTDFPTIVAWKNTAEFICKYFTKGSPILICGELQTRSWEDQQGNKRYATEVVASEASFCESKRDNEGNNTPTAHNGSQNQNSGHYGYNPYANSTPNFEDANKDDDLPF